MNPERIARNNLSWSRVVMEKLITLSLVIALVFLSACASTGQTTQTTSQPPAEEPQAPAESTQATAPAATSDSPVTVKEATPSLEPFTEQIPGTLVEFNMIPVPAGSIVMQTPEGPKTVEIEPFWIGETEVQWDAFDIYAYALDLKESGEEPGSDGIIRPSKPYGAPDRGFGHEGYAALSMTYGVALEYANWLTAKTGNTYQIPTEAQWEYACRAGGEGYPGELDNYAWYAENSNDKTQPVASKEPNAWGIYDMVGNAVEWCTSLDDEGVACGGAYMSPAAEVGCDARMEQTPAWQETDPQIPKSVFWLTDATWIGFRVIRVP